MIKLPDISVVIPTYNEAENIEKIVNDILNLNLDLEIIIVDDDSSDGTGDLAENLRKEHDNLRVIHRTERGLASAVVEGFKAAKGNIIGVIDADFSHPVKGIPKLIGPIKNGSADICIGSRYTQGGGIIGWNFLRKITSRGAILLSRPLTDVKDSVSGFFFFKRQVIDGVDLSPRGYKIGLEVIVKGRYKNVAEVPYIFMNRKVGKSKLNLNEYLSYIFHLYRLYLYKMRHYDE